MYQIAETAQPRAMSNACKVCHARELCMSSCLSDDEQNRFNMVVKRRAPLQPKERLFMAGDKLNSLFILHSGSVKTYVESSDGDHQITGFHLPGDLIGVHGLENRVHSDTVEALETSSVCELHFNELSDITKSFPSMQKQLLRNLLRIVSQEQEMMLVLGKMSAPRRIAHFIMEVSSRLQKHDLSGKVINFSMTRHDIANYLGLAVETVSRTLTRFQSMGIIAVERRSITIMDHERLNDVFDNSSDDFFDQKNSA